MNKNIWRSMVAIIAGFALGAALSIGTDIGLSAVGFLQIDNFRNNPAWVVLVVTIYRFVFNIVGSYLTARLAPANPMKHAMILGVIGTVLSLVATIAMWDKAVAWYNIAVMLMSVPSAYIGGKIYLKNNAA